MPTQSSLNSILSAGGNVVVKSDTISTTGFSSLARTAAENGTHLTIKDADGKLSATSLSSIARTGKGHVTFDFS